MGNSKNKNKNKKERKKEGGLKKKMPMVATGAFVVFFICTVVGLTIFTYQLLYKSDYFFIKENRISWIREPLEREPYRKLLNTGKGQNIFKFNITTASGKILETYPEFKNVQIVRNFPDTLALKINPRVPVAQVGERSFFLIDADGVVLTDARHSIEENIPIIAGVRKRFFRRVGQKEDSLRIVRALTLLEAVNESNFLDDHILTKIDVTDHKNISFFIEDGLEIKIGHTDFNKKIRALDNTLASMVVDKDQIRYIDLRFDDVVLGTK